MLIFAKNFHCFYNYKVLKKEGKKMKKIVTIFFLVLLSINMYSESKRFMAFAIDTGYLIEGLLKGGYGVGGFFEIKLLDNFSVSFDAGYVEYLEKVESATNKIANIRYFGTVRWYPDGSIDGVYAGIGFGSFYTTVNSDNITGYLLPVELGLKIIPFPKSMGFSIEPNATFFLKYGNSKLLFDMKYGVNIGYSF